MTTHVSIKEAKNRFSSLIRDAESGRISVITRNGKAVADVIPHVESKGGVDFEALRQWERENGGPIVKYVAPDFDDPLPDSFWFPED